MCRTILACDEQKHNGIEDIPSKHEEKNQYRELVLLNEGSTGLRGHDVLKTVNPSRGGMGIMLSKARMTFAMTIKRDRSTNGAKSGAFAATNPIKTRRKESPARRYLQARQPRLKTRLCARDGSANCDGFTGVAAQPIEAVQGGEQWNDQRTEWASCKQDHWIQG